MHLGISQDAGGRWYCCNDSSVTAVGIQSVLADKAYILFYVRVSGPSKKVPPAAGAAGAGGKLTCQASDEVGTQPQNSLLLESSLSSVKHNGCGNKSDDKRTVSSAPKTQLHFFGPRRADVDRLRTVQLDPFSGRQCSDKASLPRTPENHYSKESLSPVGRLSNGDSESVLVASVALEGDSLDSTVTSDAASQLPKSQPLVGDVCTGAASLLDLVAVATSPSMNTSSSSSNQFVGAADPASGCTGSSSGDNRVAMANREKKGSNVQSVASEGADTVLKRSRLENIAQSQVSDSGTSVSLSAVTDPLKATDMDGDQGRVAILDALKLRFDSMPFSLHVTAEGHEC